MKALVTLRKALSDPELLGSVLEGESWSNWRTLLIAANGKSLTDDERFIFEKYTGRTTPPCKRVSEMMCVIGRRGGKSKAISALACYYAALCEHQLSRGERGVVLLIAQDRRAAKVSLDYIEACFDGSAMMRAMVKERLKEELFLTNGISIEVARRSDQREASPQLPCFATSLPSGVQTRHRPIPTSRSSTRQDRHWQPHKDHWSASHRLTVGAASYGIHTRSFTAPKATHPS